MYIYIYICMYIYISSHVFILYIFYIASVRFEHSVCRGSLMTTNICIYIYIYIYIYI